MTIARARRPPLGVAVQELTAGLGDAARQHDGEVAALGAEPVLAIPRSAASRALPAPSSKLRRRK